jgi:hypothetical protein
MDNSLLSISIKMKHKRRDVPGSAFTTPDCRQTWNQQPATEAFQLLVTFNVTLSSLILFTLMMEAMSSLKK